MGKKNKREKEINQKVEPFNITDDLLKDTVLDEFIKEEFIRAGDRYEESLNAKSELDHVMIPDDMYDNIKAQIKGLGKSRLNSANSKINDKSEGLESEFSAQEKDPDIDYSKFLCEEDRNALELGRQYQELENDPKALRKFIKGKNIIGNKGRNKKSKSFYKVAASIGLVIGIFGISMSSKANRSILIQKMNHYFDNSTEKLVVMSQDSIVQPEEDTAYREIREKLNCHFYLGYKPDKFEFIKSIIDDKSGNATIWYKYNSKSLTISVNVSRDKKSSREIVNKNMNDQVFTYLQDIQINVERLISDEEIQMYSATLVYNDVYFEINSDLDEDLLYEILHGIEIYSA